MFNIIINKLISILLVFFVIFLVLNQYFIIGLSTDLQFILYFLTLVLIIISSTNEVCVNSSPAIKFINCLILLFLIIGGVYSIVLNSVSIILYIAVLFYFITRFIDLVYKKS